MVGILSTALQARWKQGTVRVVWYSHNLNLKLLLIIITVFSLLSPDTAKVDTSLTEKEVEAMVDQTAMELMVHQAMDSLKTMGQDAIEAQQKAAAAIKAHAEQLKAALFLSEKEGSLKDVSDVVLNSQKVATDCVAAAKAAQVNLNMVGIFPPGFLYFLHGFSCYKCWLSLAKTPN